MSYILSVQLTVSRPLCPPLYLSTDKVSIMQEDSSAGPSRGSIQAGLSSPKGFWGQEGKLCEGLRVRWCFLDLEMRA